MNNFHFSFPVLALRCFICTPKGPNWCILPEHGNVTDCDAVQDVPEPAPHDVCVRASYELVYGPDFGGQTISTNAITCATEVC